MNLKKWHFAGILFTLVFGTLDHFIYSWSGNHPLAAPFCAVNESTWEHLKLLVTPMLLFTCLEYWVYGKYRPGFLIIRALSILSGMVFIVVLFYGYTAFTGDNYLWADILTFILAVLAAFFLSLLLMKRNLLASAGAEMTARVLTAAIIVCFFLFTMQPPRVFLFQDPVTGQFGM